MLGVATILVVNATRMNIDGINWTSSLKDIFVLKLRWRRIHLKQGHMNEVGIYTKKLM